MTLIDTIDNTINTNRQKAANLNAAFGAKIDAIRSNPNTTGACQRQQIAAAYLNTRQSIDPLLQAENAQIAAARTTTERQVFGAPSSSDPTALIAFRDAEDRAAALEDAPQAIALLNRTDSTGDTELATAVLNYALRRGWFVVVDAYRQTHPDQATQLDQLADLQKYASAQFKFSQAIAYVTAKPAELDTMSDYAIQQLADASTTAAL